MNLKARIKALESVQRVQRILLKVAGRQQDATTGKPWPGGQADMVINLDFQPMTPEQIEAARREAHRE